MAAKPMAVALALIMVSACAAHTSMEAEAMGDGALFVDDFSSGMDAWAHEGDGAYRVAVEDGRLAVTPDNGSYGGVNVWCRTALPEEFHLEFDCVPLKQMANLVFMFAASQLDGRDLVADHAVRNGHYAWITNKEGAFSYKSKTIEDKRIPPIACYTISYWFPNKSRPAGRVPARKNPGHLLVADGPRPGAEDANGLPIRFAITKRGGRIVFAKNAEVVFDITDDGGQEVEAITKSEDGTLEKEPYIMPVYGGGYFGFRSLHAWVAFDNVRVTRPAE